MGFCFRGGQVVMLRKVISVFVEMRGMQVNPVVHRSLKSLNELVCA
jgi:hypothetical protein